MAKKKKDKPGTEKQPANSRRNPADHLKEYQFQPGQSGNYNGRPPSEISFTSKNKEMLSLPATAEMVRGFEPFIPAEWKEKGYLTRLEALCVRNYGKALSLRLGDKMAQFIIEMNDGKATMKITGADGGPIQFESKPNLKNLSDEEIRQWRELWVKSMGEGK